MAIVPKRQKITIIRSGGKDDWGVDLPDETIEKKARVDEITTVVQNQHGEEVVSTAQIWLSNLAEVYVTDTIEYTDELKRKFTRKPIKIEPIRMISGKAVETVVYV